MHRFELTYSKPTSPANVPSSSCGLGVNGRAGDISLPFSFGLTGGSPHKSFCKAVVRECCCPVGMKAKEVETAKEERTNVFIAKGSILDWSRSAGSIYESKALVRNQAVSVSG